MPDAPSVILQEYLGYLWKKSEEKVQESKVEGTGWEENLPNCLNKLRKKKKITGDFGVTF